MRTSFFKYFILIVSVAIGLFISYYFFGIFTPYNYFTAKLDIANNHPKLLTFGIPRKNNRQYQKIAKTYGFSYEPIADCNVSQAFLNRVKAYNNVTKDYLNKEFGNRWKDKFDKEVDSLFIFESKLIAIISRQKLVVLKQEELKKHGNGLSFVPVYENEKRLYRIDVNGYEGSNYVSFYRFFISPRDTTIKNIETGIIKLE